MAKIPKDVAEKVYRRYEATMMFPKSFEEMFAIAGDFFVINDREWQAYERGIVKPAEQTARIYNLHKAAADLDEPYDVGVLNSLELALSVFTGTELDLQVKPKSQREALEKALKKDKASIKRFAKLKKDFDSDAKKLYDKYESARAAVNDQKKSHAAEVKELKAKIKSLSG